MPSYPNTTAGYGSNAMAHEQQVQASLPNGGFVEDYPINLADFLLPTFAALGVAENASAAWRSVSAYGQLMSIRWKDATATLPAGTKVVTQFQMPGQYDPNVDKMQIILAVGTSGSMPANQGLTIDMNFYNPGSIDPTIGDAVVPSGTQIIAGDAAVTALTATRTRRFPSVVTLPTNFLFDMSFGTTVRPSTTTKIIKPLAPVFMSIASVIQASAASVIDLLGVTMRITRNASLNKRDARTLTTIYQ